MTLYFPSIITKHQDIQKEIDKHIKEEDGHADQVLYLTLKNHQVHIVRNLESLPNLLIIDLRNNLLTEMLGFENCRNLKELYLCENNITKIKNIDMLNKIETLDLRGNRVSQFLDKSLAYNLPASLTKFMIRCNLLVNITELVKVNNRFQVLWGDQNKFISGYKDIFKVHMSKKGSQFEDLWID